MAGRAFDVERAVDELHPLAHAGEAEAPSVSVARPVESDAVVADGEEQAAVERTQIEGRGPRTGMADDVGQRLLGHAEETEGRVPAETAAGSGASLAERSMRVRRPSRSHSAPSASARPSSSRTDGWSWYAREWTSSLKVHEALAHGAHRVGLGAGGRGDLRLADVDRQDRQPLGQVVVQLAGEECALLLLGLDQAPTQVAQRVFALAQGLVGTSPGQSVA